MFWSRSRQEVWRKGDTSGDRQFVRRGLLRLRRRHAAVRRRAGGQGRLPHRRPLLLLPGLRRRRRRAMIRPSRDEFRALARDHTVVPVWRELLADLVTPVAAFARLCPDDEPGFLLESVEHGERWGRWSFVGRRAAATLDRPGRPARGDRRPPARRHPARPGRARRGRGAAGRLPLAGRSTGCRRCTAGWSATSATTSCARSSTCPTPPDDDLGLPDACCRSSASWPPSTTGASGSRCSSNAYLFGDPTRGGARPRLRRGGGPARAAGDRRRPADRRAAASTRPTRTSRCPTCARPCRRGRYEAAVEVAREHIFAGDIFQVVLAQRFDLDLDAEPFDVYRVLRQVNPSPYMYFVRHPEVTAGRVVARADGAAARRPGDLPADRRHPLPGPHRGGRPPARRRAARAPEGDRRAHRCCVDLARNDVGRVVRFGTEQVDEMMTLERYSHVMHLTSQVSGDLAEGRTPIDVLRATLPAGTVSGAPKVRAMEIIDELEPTKRGPVRRGGRLPRLLRQHRHRHRHPHDGRAGPTARRRCRPAPASWPTRCPRTRTSSAATRPRPSSPPSPPPGA